ncbi:hypothetical protein BJI69_21150 [Luteibacter rhizovicinus DSM 16549]|uniref:DUF7931 domain-containing protein n=1 Tax=Luteibacter rhizovicinus DSM 16549 TaxID=1440763 RepID=A0A0G9H5K4_9GAMM|nr:hypothetical protein [Luteibacter rhizovicinus]APG06163.1 hypothetical protein BJI69_21150 [Luteibacter rhizovicinus DSM 16549]KLD64514.1 hypothetical protein Y883_17730 [Luteibacter rhizovicinus DSM 16549]KLD74252.1 hypothetical protein Y886_33690 [Xanthomonas hyacinthi DSM 19077]
MTGTADTVLTVEDRAGLEAAHVRLLTQARYRVAMYLPRMEPGILDSEAILTELRRLATSGRQAQVRVLTHDAEQAHREGHRLIGLAQRLPTAVSIRMPVDETHLAYASAFLADTTRGYLFRPIANRYEARGDLDAPGETSRLMAYFDEVWERAEPAWQIRPLGI